MSLRLLALCLALLCPGATLAQQPANPAETEKLAANAPRATPGGVTFTAPVE